MIIINLDKLYYTENKQRHVIKKLMLCLVDLLFYIFYEYYIRLDEGEQNGAIWLLCSIAL